MAHLTVHVKGETRAQHLAPLMAALSGSPMASMTGRQKVIWSSETMSAGWSDQPLLVPQMEKLWATQWATVLAARMVVAMVWPTATMM